MKYTLSIILMFLSVILWGCADDSLYKPADDKDCELDPGVEAYLSLSVNDFEVSSYGTREGDEGHSEPVTDETKKEHVTAAEKRINNLWVFQFAADDEGRLLVQPAYHVITDQEQLNNLKVFLKEEVASKICVVANTNSNTWGKGTGFSTYGDYLNQTIPNPSPIYLNDLVNPENYHTTAIPMEGSVTETVTINKTIKVPVSRMFAKLRICFDQLVEGISPKSIEIQNIPDYCRVKTLWMEGEKKDETGVIPESDYVTRSFNADTGTDTGTTSGEDGVIGEGTEGSGSSTPSQDSSDKEYYEIYIPENIKGETSNSAGLSKDLEVPDKALALQLKMGYRAEGSETEEERNYTVYPGGNTYNNFNVRRNCVYRINIKIHSLDEQHTPSSNCFVVKPGRGIAFEPYNRIEVGGIDGSKTDDVFRFNNYLDPTDYDSDGNPGDKVIEKVQILWQTKDAIGDNTDGDLVWIEPLTEDNKNSIHRKIYVKTNKEGNALIGAFNKDNEIIWSWHIWITDRDPGNVGNAVVYTTYKWDETKIYSWQQGMDDQGEPYDRVPGYAIMPCNLGALDNVPAIYSDGAIARTFGMLYQWGRKDPFPPIILPGSVGNDFGDISSTGDHYDNSHNIIEKTLSEVSDNKTGDQPRKVRFYSLSGNTNLANTNNSIEKEIQYSINFPYVFICGTYIVANEANSYTDSNNDFNKLNYYHSQGDWLINHNNKLWGGLEPNGIGMKVFHVDNNMNLYDNYGDKKTIFDPCPSGWRVPPGDLWLGFTKTGKNPSSMDDINYDVSSTGKTKFGMYMYMEKSKWDSADKTGKTFISNPGKTLFFPTQGTRVGNGIYYNCGRCGNYHNATTDLGNRVNIMHIHNNKDLFKVFEYSIFHYYQKSCAGPVRCVRDRK